MHTYDDHLPIYFFSIYNNFNRKWAQRTEDKKDNTVQSWFHFLVCTVQINWFLFMSEQKLKKEAAQK